MAKKRVRRTKRALSMLTIRSAVTNGTHIFAGIDHRSSWMRRFNDLILQHTADLGGDDTLTQAEHILVRRCAMLTLQLEFLEKKWAAQSGGEASKLDLDAYQRASNSLRRLLETLGLSRRAKPVPDLQDYLRAKAEARR